MDLINNILNNINNNFDRIEILPYTIKESLSNEMIFFIKPEITSCGPSTISKILELVLNTFNNYEIYITGAIIINGNYIKKYKIIEEHYGVINKISNSGLSFLSDDSKTKFNQIYQEDINKVKIYGSFQFLEKYNFFNEQSLFVLWMNSLINKLGGGTYCAKYSIDDENIYLLNGFHPRQISQYIEKDRFIIIFSIQTNTNWSILRNDMLGNNNPINAKNGSLRRFILDNKNQLGLKVVNQSNNGFHLSAGPIESLVELIRFLSDYENNKILKISDTFTGNFLIKNGFTEDKINYLMKNPVITENSINKYVFDYTEEEDLKNINEKLSFYT